MRHRPEILEVVFNLVAPTGPDLKFGVLVKKLAGAVYMTVAGLMLAGCAAAGTEQSAASTAKYVSPKKDAIQPLEYKGIIVVLRGADGFYGSWSDDAIHAAVDLTCDGFAGNEGAKDIREMIAKQFGKESNRHAFEVQHVMSAAVGIRCEEYKSKKSEILSWDVGP